MSQEIRRVPKGWEHPIDKYTGKFKPLLGDSYEEDAKGFLDKANREGLQAAIEYCGPSPDKNDYMPSWTSEEATYYMLYETVSEGTPLSPAFETKEQLAHWLADKLERFCRNPRMDYEQWKKMIEEKWALSYVFSPGLGLISGVEALSVMEKESKE